MRVRISLRSIRRSQEWCVKDSILLGHYTSHDAVESFVHSHHVYPSLEWRGQDKIRLVTHDFVQLKPFPFHSTCVASICSTSTIRMGFLTSLIAEPRRRRLNPDLTATNDPLWLPKRINLWRQCTAWMLQDQGSNFTPCWRTAAVPGKT
jgi:hypothetical protein